MNDQNQLQANPPPRRGKQYAHTDDTTSSSPTFSPISTVSPCPSASGSGRWTPLRLGIAALSCLASSPPAAPTEKRGTFLRLSMQDHYFEIVADRGAELVLLRLSDARRRPWRGCRSIAPTGSPARGGAGPRTHLRPIDGADIPVSRARASALRDAGWL